MTPARMTLNEAAAVLGIKPQSVRSRFKAGKLKGERDNSGKIWVWLDDTTPANQRGSKEPLQQLATAGEIEALKGHIATLNAELAVLRPKASAADRLDGEIAALRATVDDLRARLDESGADRRRLTDLLLDQRIQETRQSIWKRIFSR